jgi:hypothetical protein
MILKLGIDNQKETCKINDKRDLHKSLLSFIQLIYNHDKCHFKY